MSGFRKVIKDGKEVFEQYYGPELINLPNGNTPLPKWPKGMPSILEKKGPELINIAKINDTTRKR